MARSIEAAIPLTGSLQDVPEDVDRNLLAEKLDLPQVTLRATLAGLFIGSIVLVSNFQFGLQTGWVSMMSLPSALLGYAIFRISPFALSFTDVENVYIQSIAVAVGTGPLAYGLIGIIPAIEKFLTPEESGTGSKITLSLWQLMVWSLGLALFGVFFAVPLRKQVIIKEKLPFPSGSATATLISVLHGTELVNDEKDETPDHPEDEVAKPLSDVDQNDSNSSLLAHPHEDFKHLNDIEAYRSNIRSLLVTFLISATYTLASFLFPILKDLPIFGTYLSKTYMWNFQPSPAYIGQGIIMGLPTVSYMLFGAVIGWAVLGPFSKHVGWAPGPIDDWVHGGQGWILWLSLSVMISDSLVSFVVVTTKSAINAIQSMTEHRRLYDEEHHESLLTSETSSNEDPTRSTYDALFKAKRKPREVPSDYLVSNKVILIGVILSTFLCIISVRVVFGDLVPYYATTTAVVLAFFFSVLGVRALGETDLNPVSGIGKLSQMIFALVIPSNHPSKILINLVAGGIAEAGAQQAGDLMQDLKTGHLLGASPKAQFVAQLIGTMFSVALSSVMYKLYNSVYEIPSRMFRIPTAVIWIDCSRLVTGQGLPPKAFEFSMFFGFVFAVISLLKNTITPANRFHKYLVYLPNGVAVGIGIYNTPNFTLARFLGGLISYVWLKRHNDKSGIKIKMIIISSGLVLGEGLLSVFTMLLTSMGVKHF